MAKRSVTGRAWQRMLSGRRLDLLDPSPLDIEIEDIAHGLSRVARWNGQTFGAHAFSVAQHSLFVEALMGVVMRDATRAERLAALLHDAPEYVVGDMISPFKAVIGGDYKALERRLLSAVHIRFGLPAESDPLVISKIKEADGIAAYHEAVTLAGFAQEEALKIFGRPSVEAPKALDHLEPLAPDLAKAAFLNRFGDLFD